MSKRVRVILIVVVGFVVVPAIVRRFFVEAFKVPSASMAPTIVPGDHLFVNKVRAHKLPARGEVIVFAFPEDETQDFIARVVGLPGDVVEVKEGRILLNGKAIPRCRIPHVQLAEAPDSASGDLFVERLDGKTYLTFESSPSIARTNGGPWTVAAGEVWVLGDNRNNSRDSREWFDQKGGGVPLRNIRGRASWIWLSSDGKTSHSDRVGVTIHGPPTLPPSMAHLGPELQKCVGSDATFD